MYYINIVIASQL